MRDEVVGFDAGVSETIRNIVSTFFIKEEDALIYICDDDDEKGYKRFNAFDRWFNNSPMTEYIIKLDNIVDLDTYKVHTSLMFHINNTNTQNIKTAYRGITTFLSDKH